jgi:hypothetical protein
MPARKATDAHAQDFVTNDELLLSILNAFAQFTLLDVRDVFSLWLTAEQSVNLRTATQ